MSWAAVLVLVALMVLVAVALVVIAVRAVLAGGRRARAVAAARIDRGCTVARATVGRGPVGHVAALRLELARSSTATARLCRAGHGGELLADLGRRLTEACAALDGRLAAWEREPDGTRVAAALPSLRSEVAELCRAGADLRDTARDLVDLPADAALRAMLVDEVAAVRAAVRELRSAGPVARLPQ